MFGRRRGHSVGLGLVVGPEDAVEGTMTAEAVTVVGRVDGTLDVATTLHVAPTGHVHGTVRAARLAVDAGATVRAAVRIGTPPDAPRPNVMRLTPRSTPRVG